MAYFSQHLVQGLSLYPVRRQPQGEIPQSGQYYDRILRLKRYFEEERHSHNFLITHENTNNSKDLVFPFTDDQEFAVLQYIVPMQVLARKLSLDLGIDCNIPSDPQFHFKMNSYLKEG